jgi:hypothetical protein
LIIGGVILLAVSLFGVGKTFTTPAENTTLKPVKVLEYQQEGAFDYIVTAKSIYFYDNAAATTSEASPQIPVKFIENFVLNYSCSSKSGPGAESVKIRAILENPGNWKKTTDLVSGKVGPQSLSIPVDLKYYQDLGDTIDKEIGISASYHDLTIQATVSGGSGPDFVQLLPIKMSKVYIKISDKLTSSSGDRRGKFEYQVKLGENTLFGPVTLTPPASQADSPGAILGPKDTIFTKFIDNMKINYNYHLTSAQPLEQIQSEIMVEAMLENPDKWSKTYTLVPPALQKGEVTLSFPLDLKQFSTVFDTIQQETGISASNQNLTLKATLHTVAQTARGPIDRNYTQSIKTDLREGLLIWSGDLKKTLPGSIEITQPIKEQAKLLGLPVILLRLVSGLFLIFIVLFAALYFFWPKQRKTGKEEEQTRQVMRKYRELIVDVKEWPELDSGRNILTLGSIESLVQVAQGLLKPVHHTAENLAHVFWVNDDSTTYIFRSGEQTSIKKAKD